MGEADRSLPEGRREVSEEAEPLISELFARDPLKLTKEDRRAIIAKFREDRAKFVANGMKKPTKAQEKAAASAKAPSLDLDLGDL
jgi:hypothetical protein